MSEACVLTSGLTSGITNLGFTRCYFGLQVTCTPSMHHEGHPWMLSVFSCVSLSPNIAVTLLCSCGNLSGGSVAGYSLSAETVLWCGANVFLQCRHSHLRAQGSVWKRFIRDKEPFFVFQWWLRVIFTKLISWPVESISRNVHVSLCLCVCLSVCASVFIPCGMSKSSNLS